VLAFLDTEFTDLVLNPGCLHAAIDLAVNSAGLPPRGVIVEL
jgi:hypothetical protein